MTETLIGYIETVALYAPMWGFGLIFLFMTIESSFIPLPSEVVMIPAGFLAARAALSFGSPVLDASIAVLAGTAGSLAGAYVNYYLAAWLGQPFLLKYGRFILLPPEKLLRTEEVFRRYGPGVTFVCRLLPGLRHLISIPAGLSRMPHGSFILWTTLGAAIWCVILTVAGYSLGATTSDMSYAELVHTATTSVRASSAYLIPVLLVGLAAYVGISRAIMKRSDDRSNASTRGTS